MFRRTNGATGGVELQDAVLRLWGEVDFRLTTLVGHELPAHVAQVPGTLSVDASGVTFMDSAGLALVVRAATAVERAVLVAASEPVRELLVIAGALGLFRTADDG